MARARRRQRQPLEEVLAKRVRELRESSGLPRTRLAAEAGVAHSALVMIEAGRVMPNLKTLASVARVLGVRVRDLLDDEAEPVEQVTSTKTYARVVTRLRRLPERQLRHVEKILSALEGAIEDART